MAGEGMQEEGGRKREMRGREWKEKGASFQC